MKDWLAGRLPRRFAIPQEGHCDDCGGPEHRFADLPMEYVHLLGLYLGDGCLSLHRRGVYRLRIALDQRYPGIIDECAAAIHAVNPAVRVGRLTRVGDIVVSAYSKSWPCLFPQHGLGKKHERAITLMDWQRALVERWPKALLRGLIQSDGCRFINTGRGGWRHPRYAFSNYSNDILRMFCDACDLLDIRWTTAPRAVYVSRVADVAHMDEFIGSKM